MKLSQIIPERKSRGGLRIDADVSYSWNKSGDKSGGKSLVIGFSTSLLKKIRAESGDTFDVEIESSTLVFHFGPNLPFRLGNASNNSDNRRRAKIHRNGLYESLKGIFPDKNQPAKIDVLETSLGKILGRISK
jgi:hypothetical protein